MSSRILFAVTVLMVAVSACAQEAPEPRVCTDLSGKIRVACPVEKGDVPPPIPVEPGVGNSKATMSRPVNLTSSGGSSPVPSTNTGTPLASSTAAQSQSSLERSFPKNFVADQRNFWTSPLKLRLDDSRWLLPLAGFMSVVALTDNDIERQLPSNANFIRRSKSFSNYGAAAFAGTVGGAYLWSLATHNDRLRDTAVLSGEAALNTLLVTEGAKYIAGRSRPLEDGGSGNFRNGGTSFPSMHSAGAWAIASVVTRQYPGPLTKLLAYGGAAAISAARVTSRQHFASDVLVGGTLGWFIGRQVYNAHHDRADAAYGTFERARPAESLRDPASMGSPYVPLDSWIYPAIDRLAALGYIETAFAGIRPWTRMECARLVAEAGDKLLTADPGNAATHALFEALSSELAFEGRRWAGEPNVAAGVESLYARVTSISGTPLTDGYHFGQTIMNDYGRPYQEGANSVAGASAFALAGPLVFYVRAEYQRAPAASALPANTLALIGSLDGLPAPPAQILEAINRPRLMDAYLALNLSGWQLSFGRQSLWWGPGRGSAFLFTNNAEPVTMLRLSRVLPLNLPGMLGRLLGPIRTESFVGQLAGHRFVFQGPTYVPMTGSYGHYLDPQPFIHGGKLSLKPTPNLELAISMTALMSGPGVPMTFGNFLHTFSSRGSGQNRDPGDRRTSFEFTYRVPGLRNWLTLYSDSVAEDEPNPIAYPRRSAMNPGIFLSHFPGIAKLDLRAEGGYTDLPGLRTTGTYYTNVRFRDGYTNYGRLMGSWIGRQGRGVQVWSTYWFAPQKTLQVGYRHARVSDGFVPGGGSIRDVDLSANWMLRNGLTFAGKVQYERWIFPSLGPSDQTNVSGSVQITYRPKWFLGK